MTRAIITFAVLCAIYWAGGLERRATTQLKDKKGAEIVHDTAKYTLDGILDDIDPDSLLNSTNGLRDD